MTYKIKMTAEGIKETLDLIAFARAAKQAYDRSMEDKEITWTDSVHLIPVLTIAQEAFKGIRSIPREFRDLTEMELDILRSAVGEVTNNEGYRKIFSGLAQLISGFIIVFKGQDVQSL